MQEAEERRKRLKAIRDTDDGPESYASGRGKMNNPLLDGPSAQSRAPSFSFYSNPLAALKSARPQPPKVRQDMHAQGQNGAASLGHIAAAPALHLPLPSGAQPFAPFPQPEAAWPRPQPGPRPGPPSQHTPPSGHGPQWGRPPPPFGPPSSQGAQWNARPAGPASYNRGPPRPPPGPPPPGLPHQSHPIQQGRGYTGGGGRSGAQRNQDGGGRGGGRGGQVGRGRGGGGRGQGRGEAGIEAYYSPSMVEDPWRSLRPPQNRQQGDAADKSTPQPGGGLAVPATDLSTSAQGTAEEDPMVVPEEVEHGKLSEEGAQDRPWH
ncbi:hypothetical protein COCOBI_14-3960 [Coccomyxa sp. Obi]|nr:hypothetical protein COCOBI_14-3960 [Coccomyxa sp. Obi]